MESLFALHVSPWELIVRGTCMFWFLFVLFRFVLRRESGSLGLADILLIVLVADAASNGMSGDYKSISEGMVLVGTLALWNYAIDWMSYRYPWFARFAEPQVVPLIRHGRLLEGNLRRELLTVEELKGHLRECGVESIRQVKHAFLESDGKFSVVRYAEEGPVSQSGAS